MLTCFVMKEPWRCHGIVGVASVRKGRMVCAIRPSETIPYKRAKDGNAVATKRLQFRLQMLRLSQAWNSSLTPVV